MKRVNESLKTAMGMAVVMNLTLAAWGQMTPAPSAAVPSESDFYQLSYHELQNREICASLTMTDSPCHLSSELIEFDIKSLTNALEAEYELTYNIYGKEDVRGAAGMMQAHARYGHDLTRKAAATEALFSALASIKYFIGQDLTDKHKAKHPLTPDYQKLAGDMVKKAESQYAGGDYFGMRDSLYHAFWIVQPVTSSLAFVPVSRRLI